MKPYIQPYNQSCPGCRCDRSSCPECVGQSGGHRSPLEKKASELFSGLSSLLRAYPIGPGILPNATGEKGLLRSLYEKILQPVPKYELSPAK